MEFKTLARWFMLSIAPILIFIGVSASADSSSYDLTPTSSPDKMCFHYSGDHTCLRGTCGTGIFNGCWARVRDYLKGECDNDGGVNEVAIKFGNQIVCKERIDECFSGAGKKAQCQWSHTEKSMHLDQVWKETSNLYNHRAQENDHARLCEAAGWAKSAIDSYASDSRLTSKQVMDAMNNGTCGQPTAGKAGSGRSTASSEDE